MTGKEWGRQAPGDSACSPDDWSPGLHIEFKTLNTRSVKRAKTWRDVLPICLSHNLREGNQAHRHRHPIDATRMHLNQVLRGASSLAAAVELVGNTFDELSIKPQRHDAIVGIEMVVQAPDGGDTPQFWAAVLAWVDARFQHVASFVIHRDQKRPHGHILVLAVQDRQLSGSKMTSGPNLFQRQIKDFEHHLRVSLGLRLKPRPRKLGALETLALSTGKGAKTHAAAARSDAALLQRSQGKVGEITGGGRLGGGCPAKVADHLPPTTSIAPFRELAAVVKNWVALPRANATQRGWPPHARQADCNASPAAGALVTEARPTSRCSSPAERVTPIAKHRNAVRNNRSHLAPLYGRQVGYPHIIATRPSRRAFAQGQQPSKART